MQVLHLQSILATLLLSTQATHPGWVVGNLTFPFGNLTSEGADGLPIYLGNNKAEGCPKILKFDCAPCHGGCHHDNKTKRDDHRPCRRVSACHLYPKKVEEAELRFEEEATEEDTNETEGTSEDMIPMTRREILERALAWVTSNFEYKYYFSSRSPALRPTFNLEGCAAHSSSPCPVKRYLSDCSGFVGMAWKNKKTFPSPAVKHYKKASVSQSINCKDLLPGDAIAVGHRHIILFRHWLGQSPHDGTLKYVGWQSGGEWGKTNQFTSDIKSMESCHRRLNLINATSQATVIV